MSAFGFYPQALPHSFWFSLGAFLAGLVGQAPSAPMGGDPGRGRKDLPLLQVGVAAGLPALQQASGGVPLGYLRLLVFDKDSALVSAQTRQVQLSKLANGGYEALNTSLIVSQDGYVTVYVGNESDVDAFFDDVQVQHRPGLQVQETQYDPAGLELAGLAPPSPGIRGLNNYRFNGKEFQTDLGLAWNHQDWRFFDPQLLRWHSVDRLIEHDQESWTPYQFSFDNAVRYNDPDGECPLCIGFLVGAGTEYAVQVIGNAIEKGTPFSSDNFTNVKWGRVGMAGVAGALGVGVASGIAKLATVGKLGQLAATSARMASVIKHASNIASDIVSSAAGSALQGDEITATGLVIDAAAGAGGRKIESAVKASALQEPAARILQHEAKRVGNIAARNVRPARLTKVAEAAARVEAFGAQKAAIAGAVGSGAAGKVATGAASLMQSDKEKR